MTNWIGVGAAGSDQILWNCWHSQKDLQVVAILNTVWTVCKNQGRRLASFLERGRCSKDESCTIRSHPFHLWSCSEAHLRWLRGLQVSCHYRYLSGRSLGTWIRFSGPAGHRWRRPRELPVYNIQGGFRFIFSCNLVLCRVNDHVGGYAVAAPIFAGIESKFGLRFPKFRESVI